jgi:hypothetical protein
VGASVSRIGGDLDKAVGLQSFDDAGDRGPLDPLDLGDRARGERAVAGDRREDCGA